MGEEVLPQRAREGLRAVPLDRVQHERFGDDTDPRVHLGHDDAARARLALRLHRHHHVLRPRAAHRLAPPAQYYQGEIAYMWLSLFAKGVLGLLVLSNVLVLGSFTDIRSRTCGFRSSPRACSACSCRATSLCSAASPI